jgi:hypothetical protein
VAAIDESVSRCDAGYAGANNGNVCHEGTSAISMDRIGRSRSMGPHLSRYLRD